MVRLPDEPRPATKLWFILRFTTFHESSELWLCGFVASARANQYPDLIVGPSLSAWPGCSDAPAMQPCATSPMEMQLFMHVPNEELGTSMITGGSPLNFSSPCPSPSLWHGKHVLASPMLFLEPVIPPNSQVLSLVTHSIEPSAFKLWLASYPGASCQKSLWLQAELDNKHQPRQGYLLRRQNKGQPFRFWRTRTKSVSVVSCRDVSLCLTWRLVTVSLRASSEGAMTGTR